MSCKLWILAVAAQVISVWTHCGKSNGGPSPAPPSSPLRRVRPAPSNRTFSSAAVEQFLEDMMNRTWLDPDLGTLLWNCFPNTLDTTVWQADFPTNPVENPNTFISTGDIPAMWLRDSANQVTPYLRFALEDPQGIGTLLRGLIRRHVDSVLLDPYANAFAFVDPSCQLRQNNDDTTKLDPLTGKREQAMVLGVAKRQFEMDSLLSVLKLARLYYEHTNDTRPYDKKWRHAVHLIHDTLRDMQRPLTPLNQSNTTYTFRGFAMDGHTEPKDTLAHGLGRQHRYTGMVRTGFLPSDDAMRLPYHIPGNAMAVVELKATAKLLLTLRAIGDANLAASLEMLAADIDRGIRSHGIVMHSSGKRVFAMEVDGLGNFFFGDDANLPSLLSLPYLGYIAVEDPIYQSTRHLLLSNTTNPFFYGPSSQGYEGIGSEDASGNPGGGFIWPISLISRMLTATEDAEIAAMLRSIKKSSAGTGLMHESFWFEDVNHWTRYWFAWANSFLGEALVWVAKERPHLLFADVPTNVLVLV